MSYGEWDLRGRVLRVGLEGWVNKTHGIVQPIRAQDALEARFIGELN